MSFPFIAVQTEGAVEPIRPIEWAATVQLLIEELEGLAAYAQRAFNEGRVDRTELTRRFPVINRLVDETRVIGGLRFTEVDESAVAESEMGEQDFTRAFANVEVREIASIPDVGDASFGITLLQPDGTQVFPFISVVSPMPDRPKAEVDNANQDGATRLQEAIEEFVESWKRYLKYVPRALSYCGSTGLRFLPHEEAADVLGISSETLRSLAMPPDFDRRSALERYSALLENPSSVTDTTTGHLDPTFQICQVAYYDPVTVVQFAAERSDLLAPRAFKNG